MKSGPDLLAEAWGRALLDQVLGLRETHVSDADGVMVLFGEAIGVKEPTSSDLLPDPSSL